MIADPPQPDDATGAPGAMYGPDGQPQFFADPAMDRFVSVVLNLASQVWVQAEQIATLRQIVEHHNAIGAPEWAALAERAASDPARDAALNDFIGRVLAPLREGPRG